MERTITYQISESEHGLRVEQYLRHKGYSYQNLTQLKKMPESILINGIWSYMRSTLSCGDTLTVHIQESEYSEHIPPVQLPLDIIYEDDDLLVVNKPAGMPIHPSLNNYKNSLANALMYYYKEQGKPFIFRCTNRLDRDTSGLTVIAKHLVSSSILSFMAVRHEIHREYLAIVRGTVSPASGTINAPLARTGSSIIERKVDFEHGEHAVTHYKVLKEQNQHSLVSLILETGVPIRSVYIFSISDIHWSGIISIILIWNISTDRLSIPGNFHSFIRSPVRQCILKHHCRRI